MKLSNFPHIFLSREGGHIKHNQWLMHELYMNAQSEKLTHKIYMFNIGKITRQP